MMDEEAPRRGEWRRDYSEVEGGGKKLAGPGTGNEKPIAPRQASTPPHHKGGGGGAYMDTR